MTSLLTFPDKQSQTETQRNTDRFDRRTLLKGAAALAGTTVLASEASARDYGRNAEPQRYPDPDIVVIDGVGEPG